MEKYHIHILCDGQEIMTVQMYCKAQLIKWINQTKLELRYHVDLSNHYYFASN